MMLNPSQMIRVNPSNLAIRVPLENTLENNQELYPGKLRHSDIFPCMGRRFIQYKTLPFKTDIAASYHKGKAGLRLSEYADESIPNALSKRA